MKLSKNVKIKSFPWTILPITSTYTAHAIYPNIYLPRDIFENLKSSKPDNKNISILIHEQTHIKRQKNTGWLLWGIKYVFLSNFRFNEELVAIKESMKFMKSKKESWDIDRSARFLSSYLYLWCISRKKAKLSLDKVWNEI